MECWLLCVKIYICRLCVLMDQSSLLSDLCITMEVHPLVLVEQPDYVVIKKYPSIIVEGWFLQYPYIYRVRPHLCRESCRWSYTLWGGYIGICWGIGKYEPLSIGMMPTNGYVSTTWIIVKGTCFGTRWNHKFKTCLITKKESLHGKKLKDCDWVQHNG